MVNDKTNMGLIQLIVVLVILVLLISAFKVNLRGYIDSTPEQALDSNIILIIQTAKVAWHDYIVPPIRTVWDSYVAPFVQGDWLSGYKQKLQQQETLPPG